MSEALLGWLALFAVSAGVVMVAGIVLAREGDEIATRTGLGGLLVGMLLLSVATSLPEVATDVAAALEGAPDLAAGDLFGSSMANMAILALIDLLRRGRVWPSVSLGHARLAAIAIALTAVALIGILSPPGIMLGWVGLETVLLVVAYIAAVVWIHQAGPAPARGHAAAGEFPLPTGWASRAEAGHSLRVVVARFGAAAVAVLFAAPFLAIAGEGIAEEAGIGQTLVGTTLIAITTSLPELVSSLAAVQIGAFDLAVGNLFGSNAFNMMVFFAADLAYTPGAILAAVSPTQAVAALGAILLMATALAAVVHGSRTRPLRLEPGSAMVLALYGMLLVIVFSGS